MEFGRVGNEAFEGCPDESVDYEVMEHKKDAVVVTMDAN